MALLEYGLAKLPVVGTDVGECSLVVSNRKSGLVVPSNDAGGLAEALIFLIENERQRKLFGENLMENVCLNYSKPAFMTQLIAIYHLG